MAKYQGRRFLTIDGEAVDGRYVLLADSRGESVENLDGLSSRECLEFLARKLPRSASWTRVGFGLHYDVNWWVKDLPREDRLALFHGDIVSYEGYQLEYLAGRIFTIRAGGELLARIYDCLGMFRRPFITVVEDWLGECPGIIHEGKQRRERFTATEMEFVRAYNQAECEQLVGVLETVDTFLRSLPGGGISLRSWHGAGAIAAAWLRKAGARRLMRRFDDRHVGVDLLDAFERAYHGGRVEARLVGSIGPVYRYDLNSAYAWAVSHMGRLSYRWVPLDQFSESVKARMSVWLVSWKLPADTALGCFPVRSRDGGITYPTSGSGWYWWPEIVAARKRWGHRRVTVHHGWACQEGQYPIGVDNLDHGTHTLGTVLRTYYQYRHVARVGNPPGARLLKLALAAVWGKFAQRYSGATNDDEPGWWFCLPWAGWVTSCVRATILSAIAGREQDIIAISTDGIVSRVPLDLPISDDLGAWSEERYNSGTFLLPGLFRLTGGDANKESIEKTRGYERAQFDWEDILDELNAKHTASIRVRRFVGHVLPDLYADPEAGQNDPWEQMRLTFRRVPMKISPASIALKRLGGDMITGSFDYRNDHAWLGTPEGDRSFLSHFPRVDDTRTEMRKQAEADGDTVALI